MSQETIGVLVMSYGTPASMDDIEAYYTHIRRGSRPSDEQLRELTARYEAIVGGVFPLRENTNRQVAALEETLNRLHGSEQVRYVCYQGLKHASPYIEDGVAAMARDGIRRAVGLVLAPHYSAMSVGSYIQRAQEEAGDKGIAFRYVRDYHLHPLLIDALAERVSDGLARFAGVPKEEVRVIFTAHSLPEKILEMRDPYPQQLRETSDAVARAAGAANWQFAWQSAGRTATPWLGPDILDVLRVVSGEGVGNVLICPVGFVSDHLEVLYDIDIECKRKAESLGMRLERTKALGDDPRYMKTLADVAVRALNG